MVTYTWEGSYGPQGTPGPNGRTSKINGNKGFMRAYRAEKRQEAEERNSVTIPERRRSYARSLGVSRLSQYKPTN